ncbi:MAG: hypothetical protein LV481_00100 [Methylacidiphilales bacterium]|nr:hypothetical protein [Candidatus Methylacidiphilales bacterium]
MSPRPSDWTFQRELIPEPVFEKEPGYVDLYWKALELAHAHVLDIPGMPQTPYMDEAFALDTIWIWDTCFMALFCRYAPQVFPGVESLSNFYVPIHDNGFLPVKIQHPDNPPLFAWVEREYYRLTGDNSRLHWVLEDKQYLQKHFHWFNGLKREAIFPWSRIQIGLERHAIGFKWNGICSGMDNSPRFDDGRDPFVVDALAQQGLAANCISRLAASIGNRKVEMEYQRHYEDITKLINKHYWDEEDGFYYDLLPDAKTFSKVRTPASFWPVLAGMALPRQIQRMAEYVRDPDELGGPIPWTTVNRSSSVFHQEHGEYWRGALWLPTAYVGIRALSENGQGSLADETAEAVVRHMFHTWRDYNPKTIWECYSPSHPEPSSHHGNRVRPDFCGWSALGPISLFIENVLGFYDISAEKQQVEWRLHQPGVHGIRCLRFGKVLTDIISDGKGNINVTSNLTYTLIINDKSFAIHSGSQTIKLDLTPILPPQECQRLN